MSARRIPRRPLDRALATRLWWWRASPVLVVLGLLLLFGWYTLTLGDRQAEWCRRIYARAHSAADSARADRVVAGGRAPANTSCGELRQDGALERTVARRRTSNAAVP